MYTGIFLKQVFFQVLKNLHLETKIISSAVKATGHDTIPTVTMCWPITSQQTITGYAIDIKTTHTADSVRRKSLFFSSTRKYMWTKSQNTEKASFTRIMSKINYVQSVFAGQEMLKCLLACVQTRALAQSYRPDLIYNSSRVWCVDAPQMVWETWALAAPKNKSVWTHSLCACWSAPLLTPCCQSMLLFFLINRLVLAFVLRE